MSIDAFGILQKITDSKPVVHHITNWVTIYQCAEIVKAFGGSPVMAHAKNESADMANIASALVLNIGTLTDDVIEAMKLAGKAANAKGIPVILDACGAGATPYRDKKCAELLDTIFIDIIKGNSSEIARLAGQDVFTKGVDSTDVKIDMLETAETLSKSKKCAVVVTGKTDIITDGFTTYLVNNGCDLMACVVGTGCMAASVIGLFAAVEKNYALAAASGLVCFEIAAEIAAAGSEGPGSFLNLLFDKAYNLDKNSVESGIKMELL